jgi:hypothetical protein
LSQKQQKSKKKHFLFHSILEDLIEKIYILILNVSMYKTQAFEQTHEK